METSIKDLDHFCRGHHKHIVVDRENKLKGFVNEPVLKNERGSIWDELEIDYARWDNARKRD